MLPTKFHSFGWVVSEEKIKMWKVKGQWTPSDGKSSHCLWQGELKSNKTRFVFSQTNIYATSYFFLCWILKLATLSHT
jgi:hypothetical protein